MPAVRHDRLEARTCPVCYTVLSRKNDMSRHLDRHDETTKYRFKCEHPGCSYAGRQKCNINTHMRKEHGMDIPLTRRQPAPKASPVPSKLARSVSIDSADSFDTIQGQFGVFAVNSLPAESSAQASKTEEEPDWTRYLVEDFNASRTPPNLSLSQSGPSRESTSPLSTPPLAFAYAPVCAEPVATAAVDYNYDIPGPVQPAPSPSFDYDFLYYQTLFESSYAECNVECPPFPPNTSYYQQDPYATQYWNTLPSSIPAACGLPSPLSVYSQTPPYDANYPYPSDMYVQPEQAPELVFDTFPAYSDPTYEEPLAEPEPFDFSTFDIESYINYIDPSWNLIIPMGNFDAFNSLAF